MAVFCFTAVLTSLFTTSRSIFFDLCFLLSSEDSSEDSTHSALFLFTRGLVCVFVVFVVRLPKSFLEFSFFGFGKRARSEIEVSRGRGKAEEGAGVRSTWS